MSGRKELTQELITRIVSLSDVGHQTKEISELTGVSGRSIRRWVARYREEGGFQVPTQKPRFLSLCLHSNDGSSLSHVI